MAGLVRVVASMDAWLMSRGAPTRAVVLLLTLVSMTASAWPRLQRADPGPDAIADLYESRVVRNDWRDMYTKRLVQQTPLEAETWSKEASSPYPPATLLSLAGLAAIGGAIGVGLHGMVTLVAAAFLAMSLAYFLRTRWYLFPLVYLNFGWIAERFFFVQDGSYLVMLTVVMSALLVARRTPGQAHALMALAITMKLSPLYYLSQLPRMSRRSAVVFVAVLAIGLVLPYFVWENYLYIFRYNDELKGDWISAAGALAIAAPFAALLWWVERQRAFDLEELVGWASVPVALFFAFKMNAARHLLLVLLIPDKTGVRNVAAAVGLALPALLPSLIRLNDVLPAVTAVLAVGLWLRSRTR